MGLPEDRILLAENGQIIEFDEQGGRLGGRIPTGKVLVDGKGIGDVGRKRSIVHRIINGEGGIQYGHDTVQFLNRSVHPAALNLWKYRLSGYE